MYSCWYGSHASIFIKVKSEYSDHFGCLSNVRKWDDVDCAVCMCMWKRNEQLKVQHTHTETRSQCVYVQKMLVTCFSLCCAQFVIHFFSFLHRFACMCLCIFVHVFSFWAATELCITHSFSRFFFSFRSIFYQLSCRKSFTRFHRCTRFIVLVRPVLWIFVWETYLYVVWSPQY